jgi:hypothetical protein
LRIQARCCDQRGDGNKRFASIHSIISPAPAAKPPKEC